MVGGGFGEAVQPDRHLIWSHYGYGLILVGLSRLIGPNAHGLATIFAIRLSMVLMIQASLQARRLSNYLWVLLFCFGDTYLNALLSADFTMASVFWDSSGLPPVCCSYPST